MSFLLNQFGTDNQVTKTRQTFGYSENHKTLDKFLYQTDKPKQMDS